MRKTSLITGLVLSMSLPFGASAQDSGAASDTTLYRVRSETFRTRMEGDLQVWLLEGGVRIDHQTATVTSERGRHYPSLRHTILEGDVRGVDGSMRMYGEIGEYFGRTNTLIMIDDVRLIDDGLEVNCRRAVYDRDDGTLILTGDVRLADSTRVMYADSVFYDRGTEVADAYRNVVIIDVAEDFSVSGSHGRFFRKAGRAVMDESPVLVFDERAAEQGRVKSLWMEYDMDRQVGTAVGNVRMVKGETRASCDSAVIYDEEQYMELFGDPVARSGSSGMSGTRVVLHYDGEGIRRIVLPETGRLTEAPDPGSPWRDDSWIEGDSLVIYMSEEEVDSVRIFGGARAMYYPYEGTENKVSNNYSSGDTMFFRFDGADLRYVRISGDASGEYNYLNLESGETVDSTAARLDTTLSWVDFSGRSQRVAYQARKIEYFATTEDIVLHEGAEVVYQKNTLNADFINFSSRLNILEAEGDPVLEESGQKMYGEGMGYDMESEGGLVAGGSTKYGEGYYLGKRIFKEGDDILKVYGSVYTTCDYRQAHYSMRAGRMKVYIDDKIVSGPITLYIGEIPCFYLPFMVNSIQRDRHSGFLRPNFDIGINSRDGRFIRGLGYYWATNDYTDFILTSDFNEYRNFRVHLTNRYKVRYLLSGNVNLDFFRDFNANSYEWTFKSAHSQKFGKTASLRSDLSFVSSDQAPSSVHQADDIDRIVDRRIYSTANFSKSWDGTRLNLSATRNQKLNVSPDNPTENRITTTMPSLSLNLPRTSLWFGENNPEGQRSVWESFLRGVTFSPNLRASRTTEQSEARRREKVSASSGTSFGKQNKLLFLNISPSIGVNWNYEDVINDFINPMYVDPPAAAVLVGDTVTAPTALFPLTIGPGANRMAIELDGVGSGELVVPEGDYFNGISVAQALEATINSVGWSGGGVTVVFLESGDGTGRFVISTVGTGPGKSLELLPVAGEVYPTIGFAAGQRAVGTGRQGLTEDTTYRNEVSMRMSVGLGATLYGLFYPRIGPLVGIRHTFNPSISYSYSPALTGNQVSTQSMSWSLRNVIDLKYLSRGEEKKSNGAFTWNMSGSIDPEGKRERTFSNISSSMRTSLGRLASIDLTNTFDPYEREVLSTRFSASMSLGGSFSWPGSWSLPAREKIAAARDMETGRETGEGADEAVLEDEEALFEEYQGYEGFAEEEVVPGPVSGETGSGNAWTLSLGYSYSGFGGVAGGRPSTKLDMRGTLNLTTAWRMTWSAYYDIEAREFTTQQYSLNRDLHCWQAGFVHRRFGDDFSFYFQIQIKAHPDIQYERGKRGLGGSIPGYF